MVVASIVTLFGLGLAASIILAVAARVFYVEEDPRIEAVLEALPGANCGGCGFAGCEGYARAVLNDPNVPANKCCAGGAATSVVVGELTGKTVAEAEPLFALRRCDKLGGQVGPRYEYQGMPSCAAAALMRGGTDECAFSCLGFGDCVQACPFDAMRIVDGVVEVNTAVCTGCGTCIAVCPRGVLELTPLRARVAVYCNTREKLRAVTDVCKVGCIKCMKCVKACPAKAVRLEDNRIVIDHMLCCSYGTSCHEACVAACPRKIFRYTRPPEAAECTEDAPDALTAVTAREPHARQEEAVRS
ncbi:RnfABCDGE type electron transport complex subunit B [Desulfovibrio legallii]|jgi:electron transport complex protein RnfB|uniref:Ion-translocating oxidoreductase complex subunit B n=1 Tax=Desulfovibrio legallii TaxID=571438 RepID=A0A1G7HWJ8_9BACT|nr:Fe-S cluster domain-containing protein [Desulfovibrio legallii]SDF04626.1 electron transport complex protein RnfB [Desulfovibrio legallii]